MWLRRFISRAEFRKPITDVNVANCRFLNTSSANSFSFTNRISFINNKGGGF